MRCRIVAVLIACEAIVGCSIMICSLELSRVVVGDAAIARVAHAAEALARKTHRLADVRVRIVLLGRA